AISDCFNDPDCFTEKLIEPANNKVPFVKPEFTLEVDAKTNPERIDIAVVSSFMKINGLYMELCKEIVECSEKEVIFHFYPMANGIFYHYVSKIIKAQLPNAFVYKSLPYNGFINSLARCDIRLGTFPFGGTNTNIDCFALGIPYVTLAGPEAFSHQDTVFFQRAGLSDELVAEDLDDYVGKVLKLIDDDDYRSVMSRKFQEVYDSNILFEGDNDENRGITANTIKWVYNNASTLKSSSNKVFREGDELH
ncbi:MAG: hypothetical protein V2I33_04670, partial [Kangiellaceae bacterium]|nr:hypothetical protein [Kangiellaceae bacterium]